MILRSRVLLLLVVCLAMLAPSALRAVAGHSIDEVANVVRREAKALELPDDKTSSHWYWHWRSPSVRAQPSWPGFVRVDQYGSRTTKRASPQLHAYQEARWPTNGSDAASPP
jgi:hypothetical protein